MSKQSKSSSTPAPTYDTSRLVVWGEERENPDWDAYVAALLAWALREVEGTTPPEEGTS
jgi:hypothetical protein